MVQDFWDPFQVQGDSMFLLPQVLLPVPQTLYLLKLLSSKVLGSHLSPILSMISINYNLYYLCTSDKFPNINPNFSPLSTLQNPSFPLPEPSESLSHCTHSPQICPLSLSNSNRCSCCCAQQALPAFFSCGFGLKYYRSAYTIMLLSPKWSLSTPFLINILCLRHTKSLQSMIFFFPEPLIYSGNKSQILIFIPHCYPQLPNISLQLQIILTI